ncbi:hypothetical protein JD844_014804 [Phrynosoma platyrhinos]|uniref:Uncharacterized protein n=1 Tax=Phrynosoma platyrhinos TaxID=52577 RepID=A0ABQ7SRX9_PHRPL|nr:hypothetical protein JD844_014804 [Phrynosoma platyrhinos]
MVACLLGPAANRRAVEAGRAEVKRFLGATAAPGVRGRNCRCSVELVQLVIDGVNYLIDCERRLERGQDIRIPSPVPQFRS